MEVPVNMLRRFKTRRAERLGEIPIWIKIRIDPTSHEHASIDRYLAELAPADADFEFEKHESGPEILVFLAVAAAGVSLAKSAIDLVTTIIKARSETWRKRDLPFKPVELIVRRVDERLRTSEEVIIYLGQGEAGAESVLEEKLMAALREIAKIKRQQGK